jgi:hypothetical protein
MTGIVRWVNVLDDNERKLIILDVKKTCYSNSVKNITMLTTKIRCKNNALENINN